MANDLLDEFDMDLLAEDAFSDQADDGSGNKRTRRKRDAAVPAFNVKVQRMVDPLKQYEMFPNGHPRFLTKGSKVKILGAQMHFASTMGCFDYGSKQPTQTAHVTERDVADLNDALGRTEGLSRSERLRKRKGIAKAPDSSAALLMGSAETLPEPVLDVDVGDPSSVVTLRVRSISPPIMKLPDFAEGDIVVGVVQRNKQQKKTMSKGLTAGPVASDGAGSDGDANAAENDGGDNDDDDDDDESGSSDNGRADDENDGQVIRVFRVHGVYWGIRAYVNMMVDGMASAEARRASAARSRSENNCFLVCSVVKEAE